MAGEVRAAGILRSWCDSIEAVVQRVRIDLVVAAIGVGLTLLFGFALARKHFFPRTGPQEMNVRIDSKLELPLYWREGPPTSERWGPDARRVEVDAQLRGERDLYIRNRLGWSSTHRDIEFRMQFDPPHRPVVHVDMHLSWGGAITNIRGYVTLNSDKLPTDSAAPLLMDYLISSESGGSGGTDQGTIAVFPEDLR
jgi:hypothetical protein